MKKIKVGILGATGMVGQRFVQLLENHPWFEVAELAASEKSAGKTYEETGKWRIRKEIPEYAKDIIVKECTPDLDCKLVFSALDSSIAGEIETKFAESGYIVSSNARNHRWDMDVPLLVPEVNPVHLEAVKKQKTSGFIVTDPNCSTIGLVIPLKALKDEFGLKKVFVTTMQALSGAGFEGLKLDIQDNLIPLIKGEEEKVESEPLKILGVYKNGKFVNADLRISAHCNRVNVLDGHTECVNVELEEKPSLVEVKECLRKFNPLKGLNLPSAPNPPIIIKEEENRPQPKYDRDLAKGMAISIGRIRNCNILDYKFVILSHNTIRGAAGAAILNAELMKKRGFI